MEGMLILLVLGFFLGWGLEISAWFQARRLRREVAAFRLELAEAGIVAAVAPAAATWTPPAVRPEQSAEQFPAPAEAPAETVAAETVATIPAPARAGLEEALTLRWGMWLGAAAILLAGVFLVRTAVEEEWLGPAARCGLGGLLGLALIGVAEWLRRRPPPPAAQTVLEAETASAALDDPSSLAAEAATPRTPDLAPAALAAGGVAVLFGAAYATAVMYALVPPLLGFALLALTALAGLALALLHGPLVAAIGIACAYGTPALVEADDPSLPGLFGYLLVVTAAALAVVRQVGVRQAGAAWLGWVATLAAAAWVVAGGSMAGPGADLWAPALFVPLAAALHLALPPDSALENELGRRLAWVPFAVLAGAALLLASGTTSLAPAAAILLLTPVAIWKGAGEPRLDRLPWLAGLAGLLLLFAWNIPAWSPPGEEVTISGVVQAVLPNGPWLPEALWPFLGTAALLAAMHALAGFRQERRAPHPLRWAALPAAVPVLALLIAYARVAGFTPDARWAMAALALAALLIAAAAAARKADALQRAGVHAAGAVAALALGCAMLLADQWLTMAVALFLPPLAWVEARTDLPPLRRVATAVAAVVLVRLLLNWAVLDYPFGATPVLNGLLAAYGVPAAAFALAAMLFRRRGDDTTVAVLEAGALAFATALVFLEIRHAVTGGELAEAADWTFREAALQLAALALLAALVRLLDRRLGGRPMLSWGWRLQQVMAIGLGVVLPVANPAFDNGATLLPTPVLNELLLAYALPALLAAAAARAPETARPPAFRAALALYALAAGFAWVTLEVRHDFHLIEMALDLEDIEPAELYAYSGAWLGFGACLLALGIRSGIKPLRLAALAMIGLTILKAFVVDMNDLQGLWRVLSFLGLGLALIALGWVYRRFVVMPPAPALPA